MMFLFPQEKKTAPRNPVANGGELSFLSYFLQLFSFCLFSSLMRVLLCKWIFKQFHPGLRYGKESLPSDHVHYV